VKIYSSDKPLISVLLGQNQKLEPKKITTQALPQAVGAEKPAPQSEATQDRKKA
jgi:hypothetical protein